MLVDLNLAEREVLIIGGGKVGERKAVKFLERGCSVVIGSKDFTDNLRRLGEEQKVKLVEGNVESDRFLLNRLVSKADIVIAATDDRIINGEIAKVAKNSGALVCVVDEPSESDFALASVTDIDGIQIAVYTGGKCPAMARQLCDRIGKTITQRDVLQLELLYYARVLAKDRISDKGRRRDLVYRVLQDNEVNRLLEKGLLKEAKAVVENIICQN